MPWMYAIVGLLVGAVVGIIISRLTTPEYKKQKLVYKELAATKFEIEQQRQELVDHFAAAAEMLETLGKDYTKLYQHMSQTATDMLPNLPEQDNPFDKKVAEEKATKETSDDDPTDEQPKDYANGATGLFNEQPKEILEAPEVVQVKAS